MSVDLTISMAGYGEASTVLGNWFRFMFCTKYSAAVCFRQNVILNLGQHVSRPLTVVSVSTISTISTIAMAVSAIAAVSAMAIAAIVAAIVGISLSLPLAVVVTVSTIAVSVSSISTITMV